MTEHWSVWISTIISAIIIFYGIVNRNLAIGIIGYGMLFFCFYLHYISNKQQFKEIRE